MTYIQIPEIFSRKLIKKRFFIYGYIYAMNTHSPSDHQQLQKKRIKNNKENFENIIYTDTLEESSENLKKKNKANEI